MATEDQELVWRVVGGGVLTFAAIGSRRLGDHPKDEAIWRSAVAAFGALAGHGIEVVMRTGGAEGADTAAAQAFSGRVDVILPWRGFNGHHEGIIYSHDAEAAAYVDRLHPAPGRLSSGARLCLERDVWQVIGPPWARRDVDLVLAWTPSGMMAGGSAMAMRTAFSRGIPVFNIGSQEGLEGLRRLYLTLCRKLVAEAECPRWDGSWKKKDSSGRKKIAATKMQQPFFNRNF